MCVSQREEQHDDDFFVVDCEWLGSFSSFLVFSNVLEKKSNPTIRRGDDRASHMWLFFSIKSQAFINVYGFDKTSSEVPKN